MNMMNYIVPQLVVAGAYTFIGEIKGVVCYCLLLL